VHFRQNL